MRSPGLRDGRLVRPSPLLAVCTRIHRGLPRSGFIRPSGPAGGNCPGCRQMGDLSKRLRALREEPSVSGRLPDEARHSAQAGSRPAGRWLIAVHLPWVRRNRHGRPGHTPRMGCDPLEYTVLVTMRSGRFLRAVMHLGASGQKFVLSGMRSGSSTADFVRDCARVNGKAPPVTKRRSREEIAVVCPLRQPKMDTSMRVTILC